MPAWGGVAWWGRGEGGTLPVLSVGGRHLGPLMERWDLSGCSGMRAGVRSWWGGGCPGGPLDGGCEPGGCLL